MQIRNIFYSPHFEKSFKLLPHKIKKQASEKGKVFRKDCFDERLRTHKLKGKLKKYWSFSVNHSYRILFEFYNQNEVIFSDIGTHSIYLD